MKKLIQYTMMPVFAVGVLALSSCATPAASGSCEKKCCSKDGKSCCSKDGKECCGKCGHGHAH